MADTFADLLREVGISDEPRDTRSQAMQAAQQRPQRRPMPRQMRQQAPPGPPPRDRQIYGMNRGDVLQRHAMDTETARYNWTYGDLGERLSAIPQLVGEATGLASLRYLPHALRAGDTESALVEGGTAAATLLPEVAGARGLFGAGRTRAPRVPQADNMSAWRDFTRSADDEAIRTADGRTADQALRQLNQGMDDGGTSFDDWVGMDGGVADVGQTRREMLPELIRRQRTIDGSYGGARSDNTASMGEIIGAGTDPRLASGLPRALDDYLGPFRVGGESESAPLLGTNDPRLDPLVNRNTPRPPRGPNEDRRFSASYWGDRPQVEPPPAPLRPPPRQIGANGLPVRPPEPFRNSMRGGSEDLREAARPRAQQLPDWIVRNPTDQQLAPPRGPAPKPPAPSRTPFYDAFGGGRQLNSFAGVPPVPRGPQHLQNTKLARLAEAEILGPGALDQRVARALALNPDLTDAQITTMLYGANRSREAAIGASRQRVTGQLSPPPVGRGTTSRRPVPQQPLPPVPEAYGAHLTPLERRVAQALEVNPSLSDSQINTMLFGASLERPEDKLIGIIRRNLERKTTLSARPQTNAFVGIPTMPPVVQQDFAALGRMASDGSGAAPRALPRQYAGFGGRAVAMGDFGKLPFHEGPRFLGQLPRRANNAPVDPKAVWAGAGLLSIPTGAATAGLVTQNAAESAATEHMAALNAQNRERLDSALRAKWPVYQNPGKPAWEDRRLYVMPGGELDQPNPGYAINPATGRPLPAPKFRRNKNAPARTGAFR